METNNIIIWKNKVTVKLIYPYKLEQWFINYIEKGIEHGYCDWPLRSKANKNIIWFYYVKEFKKVEWTFNKYKSYLGL